MRMFSVLAFSLTITVGCSTHGAVPEQPDPHALGVPNEVAALYQTQIDWKVSDNFDAIDPTRWEKRANKQKTGGAAGNIKASHNQIKRDDTSSHLSLLATKDGEAGLSAFHPHRYGFTVCRWRVQSVDAEKKYAAHPAIWGFSYNMGDTGQNAPNPNGQTIEIDWFEYIKWEKIYHSRVIPAHDGQSDIPNSVFMFDHRTDFAGWKTYGLEYTPEHVRTWEHVEGVWQILGDPVRFADETNQEEKTIDRDHRSDQYFILSNIWFYKPEYKLTPVRMDIDYLHHYPLK